MTTEHKSTNLNRPFIAGLWLITAIPLSVVVALAYEFRPIGATLDSWPAAVAIILIHFAAGYYWARSLTRRSGLPDSRAMAISGGIGFTFFVIGLRYLMDVYQLPFERLFLSLEGRTHLQFAAIFLTWTGLVTGGTGFALGLGKGDLRLALKLLILGFITGAAVFALIAFLFDSIGWRVGAPTPNGRPTMVIVTLTGIWSAALLGSELFGRLLALNNWLPAGVTKTIKAIKG